MRGLADCALFSKGAYGKQVFVLKPNFLSRGVRHAAKLAKDVSINLFEMFPLARLRHGAACGKSGKPTNARVITALRQRRGDCHAGDLPARCETRGRQRR